MTVSIISVFGVLPFEDVFITLNLSGFFVESVIEFSGGVVRMEVDWQEAVGLGCAECDV